MAQTSPNANKTALKRLNKELADIHKHPPVEMSIGPVGDNFIQMLAQLFRTEDIIYVLIFFKTIGLQFTRYHRLCFRYHHYWQIQTLPLLWIEKVLNCGKRIKKNIIVLSNNGSKSMPVLKVWANCQLNSFSEKVL